MRQNNEMLDLIDPLISRGWQASVVVDRDGWSLHMLTLGDPNDAGHIWIMEDMYGPDGEPLFESDETDEAWHNLDIAQQMVARAEEM